MSVELPTFVFPSPGPVLPPSPESTIEPMPSGDDPRLQNAYLGLSNMHWYLYSALQIEESYPELWLVPPYIDIHMGDVLEPMSGPPSQSEWVLGWNMSCLLCPLAADGGERERDTSTGYPFCDEGTLSMEPLVSHAEQREWNGERKWEVIIPNSTVSGLESVMACAIELILKPEMVQEAIGTGNRPRSIGQPFLVSRSFRGNERDYPENRNRFSATFPYGTTDQEVQEEEKPSSSPTLLSSSTPWYYNTTSSGYSGYWPYHSSTAVSMPTSGSLFRDRDDDDPDLNTGAQAAMGVCLTVVGLAVILLFLSCSRRARAKWAGDLQTTDGLPTQEARQQEATAEGQHVARLYAETATGTHGGREPIHLQQEVPAREPSTSVRASDATEEGSGEVLPLYHEVVSNRERMAIEQRMHREGSARNGWPPSYD